MPVAQGGVGETTSVLRLVPRLFPRKEREPGNEANLGTRLLRGKRL